MARDPRVAVIGAGAWGRNLVRVLHELGVLKVICEPNPTAAAAAREIALGVPTVRLHEELADYEVDAVVIATPAETHFELARWALRQGLDVFIEKPMCLTLAEAERLTGLATSLQRRLMVGHVLLYHPAVRVLTELVRDGSIGELQYIYSHRLSLGRLRRKENILWSFAPHDIAVIQHLVGEPPCRVVACGMSCVRPRVADVTITHLSFPRGEQAHVHVSWLHPFKEQRLVVIGSKAMLSFDDVNKRLVLYDKRVAWHNGRPTPVDAGAREVGYPQVEPLKEECAAFIRYLQEEEMPVTAGRHGLEVVATLEAAQRSLAAGGQPTPVTTGSSISSGSGHAGV